MKNNGLVQPIFRVYTGSKQLPIPPMGYGSGFAPGWRVNPHIHIHNWFGLGMNVVVETQPISKQISHNGFTILDPKNMVVNNSFVKFPFNYINVGT